MEEVPQGLAPAKEKDGVGRVRLEGHGPDGELHLDPVAWIRHEDVFSDEAPEREVAEDGRPRVAEGAHQHCV